MTRWESSDNAAAAAENAVCMVCLCDLDFSDGTIRVHDGLGTLSFSGNTYVGVGDFGGIDAVRETTEVIAKSVTLALSGVPGPLLTEAMTQNYQGREVVLYIGLLDVNALTWIDTPEVLWEGRMDYMTVDIGPNTTSIKLTCESRLNREPLVARYTDVDQQLAYPGDTFFNLVWMIPLANAGWGGVTVQYPLTVPPAGRQQLGGSTNGGIVPRMPPGAHQPT